MICFRAEDDKAIISVMEDHVSLADMFVNDLADPRKRESIPNVILNVGNHLLKWFAIQQTDLKNEQSQWAVITSAARNFNFNSFCGLVNILGAIGERT